MRSRSNGQRSVWLSRPEVVSLARITLVPVVLFVLIIALWRESVLPTQLEGGFAKHVAAFFVISTLYQIAWPGSVVFSVAVLFAGGAALELPHFPFEREFDIFD